MYRLIVILIVFCGAVSFAGTGERCCLWKMESDACQHQRMNVQHHGPMWKSQCKQQWREHRLQENGWLPDYRRMGYKQEAQVSLEWQSMGPEGGNIISMAMHPDNSLILYALPYVYPCRIYKTTDGGAQWKTCNQQSPIYDYVTDIAIDSSNPNILYVSCESEYLYKSTDAGKTWTEHTTNSDWNWLYALTVDPCDPNILWAAADDYDGYTWQMAVAKSTDGGVHWNFTSLNSKDGGYGSSIIVLPGSCDIIVGGSYYDYSIGSQPGLYTSTDGGSHWTDIGSNIGGSNVAGWLEAVAVHPDNADVYFAGGYFYNIYSYDYFFLYKSTDGGSHWTNISGLIATDVFSLAIDAGSPNTVYTGCYDGIYKSTNQGSSWNPSGSGLMGIYVWDFLIDSNSSSTLYAANQVGIFQTTDSGASWAPSYTGLVATKITDLVVSPSAPNIVYIGVEDDALYKSIDSGAHWTRVREFVGCHGVTCVDVDPHNENRIYIFTGG